MNERWEVSQHHADQPDLLGSEPRPGRIVGVHIGGYSLAAG